MTRASRKRVGGRGGVKPDEGLTRRQPDADDTGIPAETQHDVAHLAKCTSAGPSGSPQSLSEVLTLHSTQEVVWEKVLWKRQPFPDNYTPDSFLQHLVVNAEVPQRRYWPVVLASAAVTQQLSCVAASAVAVPLLVVWGRLGWREVLGACAALLALGYATCAFLGSHLLGGSLARGVRQCVLLVGGVYCLSPLLRSLTGTVSTDSVVALAVVLLLAHLFLCDYNFVNSVTDRLTGALSLGAACLAAVLIAGRMPSDELAFVHVLFSLELYLLSPYARRYVRQRSVRLHVGVTVAMAAAAAGLLLCVARAAAAAFVAADLLLTFVCPLALVRAHKYKAKISGPWDEAAPHIPRELVLVRPPGRRSASMDGGVRGDGATA